MTTIAPITIAQLTQAEVDGTGVFDVLMRATKGHLEQEYNKNRIKGGEYATVYLGSLEHVLRAALQFLLEKDKNLYEAELIRAQVLLAEAELAKTLVDTQRLEVEVLKAQAELVILQLNATKIPAEIVLLTAQAGLVTEQAGLVTEQTANAVVERTVLQAQKCKLDAEFDVLQAQKIKVAGETTLLAQKTATEKAQIDELGVDLDSVIGRQKALYKAQTDGFSRDAEQRAADIMVKTWNVRRTTDEGTIADGTNMLNDVTIGRSINKLLQGVGA